MSSTHKGKGPAEAGNHEGQGGLSGAEGFSPGQRGRSGTPGTAVPIWKNILSIAREKPKQNIEKQGTPVDRDPRGLPPPLRSMPFYNPSANEIIFPAAILQAPFYDISAAREENLGGIGICNRP